MCAMEANNKRVTRPLKLSNEMLRFAYSSHSKTELPNKGIAQYEIQCPFQQQHCNHFYAFFRPFFSRWTIVWLDSLHFKIEKLTF